MPKQENQTGFKRYKVPKDQGFTVIPNKLIVNKELPPIPKLVLIYLLHNSEDWKVYQHKIREDLNIGICSLRTAIAQLEKLGYLRRRQLKEKGKFSHYEYEYHSEPIFLKCSQLPIKPVHNPIKRQSPANGFPLAANLSLPMTKLTSSSKKKKDNVTPASAVSTLQLKKQESGKKAKTMDITKRYRLTEEQRTSFELMKRVGLPTDDPTLCYYAKRFTLQRINAALIEMNGKRPQNPGGYFRKLLMKELDESKANTLVNSEFAQVYKETMAWKDLLITKTHVETPTFKISLAISPDTFTDLVVKNMPE